VSASGELSRLEAILDASGVPTRIEMLLPVGVRPRQLTVRTLLTGILIALLDGRPAHLRRIHEALSRLSETDKQRLGVIARWKTGPHQLTYRQTERTFGLVVKALAKDTPDGKPSQILSEITDTLLEASVQVLGCPQSSALAIDWTGYESFARPPHKDGRCGDPEAAWGHRNTNHPALGETFFGYYLQAATIVKEENSTHQTPELVRRITLSSARHDPPEQIVPVIERLAADGIHLGDLLADSGYSYRAPQTFATPMRSAGAKLVMDLHPNDRGCKGTHQGAVISNGNLYCPATPKALFELCPPAPATTEQELQTHDQKTEELSRYKLGALTTIDQDGYHRAICPAAAGKIRCPHKPESLTLSHEHPTILSPPENAPVCCAQKTITVPPSVGAKTAQKHDYPSQAHKHSYARRNAAERSFSHLHDPASNDTKRGWCRLTGLTGPALFLACAFITTNIRVTDAFTARQAENEQRAARGLPPKRRRRRRRTVQDLTEKANAPPAIAA
jgi:hypothetical protein